VLRLPAGTTGFFFLRERAVLNSLRTVGDSCKVEIALIKASSSCLSIMLRHELLTTQNTTRDRSVASRVGTTDPVRTSHHSLSSPINQPAAE
jgi:hypothetical protein